MAIHEMMPFAWGLEKQETLLLGIAIAGVLVVLIANAVYATMHRTDIGLDSIQVESMPYGYNQNPAFGSEAADAPLGMTEEFRWTGDLDINVLHAAKYSTLEEALEAEALEQTFIYNDLAAHNYGQQLMELDIEVTNVNARSNRGNDNLEGKLFSVSMFNLVCEEHMHNSRKSKKIYRTLATCDDMTLEYGLDSASGYKLFELAPGNSIVIKLIFRLCPSHQDGEHILALLNDGQLSFDGSVAVSSL